jgi:hypothetical protein
MTLVFGTAAGALLQTQISRADIIATISGAQTAWGWIGGLDDFKNILSVIHGSFAGRNVSKLVRNLGLSPTAIRILTPDGSIPICMDNEPDTFSGDTRTQLIGLTICALAHECGGNLAVRLFIRCLGPALFTGADSANRLQEALQGQLNDNLQRILNEGAARGYTKRFTNAVLTLGIAHIDREWLRNILRASDTAEAFPTEIAMVGGLLTWLTQETRKPYFTRSVLVAHVAICLKSVGYLIDNVTTWNGSGEIPLALRSGSVILVLGGSAKTDPLMLDHAEFWGERHIHYYHYSTVGSMLSNALGNQQDSTPEIFQTNFGSIYSHIEKHLAFEWTTNLAELHSLVRALAKWKPYQTRCSPISIRLTSIYFTLCAEMIAPCYEGMACNEALHQVLQFKSVPAGDDLLPGYLAMFRALTASIVISVWSRLAGPNFEAIRHATIIDLTDEEWLDEACGFLN